MIPTKNASSDMNSADNPRNETTRLSALATGFRLRTTAAPKNTVSTAKIQNRNGDIRLISKFRRSDFRFGQSLLVVPFHYCAVHYSAVRSVILNEVKDLSSPTGADAYFVRSLAFARDDCAYFFSFHFNTTPCITPPISRSLSL